MTPAAHRLMTLPGIPYKYIRIMYKLYRGVPITIRYTLQTQH